MTTESCHFYPSLPHRQWWRQTVNFVSRSAFPLETSTTLNGSRAESLLNSNITLHLSRRQSSFSAFSSVWLWLIVVTMRHNVWKQAVDLSGVTDCLSSSWFPCKWVAVTQAGSNIRMQCNPLVWLSQDFHIVWAILCHTLYISEKNVAKYFMQQGSLWRALMVISPESDWRTVWQISSTRRSRETGLTCIFF